MRNRAFTFVELLVVCVIIAVLAALLFPVFSAVRGRARQTVCVENLRQIAQAIAMYRTAAGGDGVYGDMYSMGLPPFPVSRSMPMVLKLVPCDGPRRPPEHSRTGFSYRYVPSPPSRMSGLTVWADYATEHRDESIVCFDEYHNPKNLSLESPLTTKTGIGVRLSCSICIKKKSGLMWELEWWD
jgi:prepilin-type N-terminal cleavage/methylation domain-containing protein